jgi:hypothetical protein
MNIRYFVCLVLAMMCVSSLALAQEGREVDETQLPPGKTKVQVQAMLKEIDRKTENELKQELAAVQRQDERLQRVLRKYEDRVRKAVERDPELQALRDKLEAGSRALNNPQLSDKEREARSERMAPDMRAYRQKALAKAGIDERAMNAEIVREMNSGVTTRGGGEGESTGEILEEKDGVLYFVNPNEEEPPPESEVTTRGTSTVILGDPWPWSQSGQSVDCLECEIDKGNGSYKVWAHGFAFESGQAYRGLAQYHRVQSGDKTYRVSARLPEASWSNYSRAGLWSSTRSRTWSKIEVWDDSSKRLCRNAKLHKDLVALWGQSLPASGKDTVSLACEFAAPPANHDVVIRFVSGGYVRTSSNWAAASAKVRASPRDVTLYITR